MKLTLIALLAALIATAADASDAARWRGQHRGVVAAMQACADDYVRLCVGAGTDRDAVHDCLVSHRASVSAACMSFVNRYKKEAAQ